MTSVRNFWTQKGQKGLPYTLALNLASWVVCTSSAMKLLALDATQNSSYMVLSFRCDYLIAFESRYVLPCVCVLQYTHAVLALVLRSRHGSARSLVDLMS